MRWSLPSKVDINGSEYLINADYRVILGIISRLNDPEQDDFIKVYVCLALFYPAFEEIPESSYQEAMNRMFWFISCGEEPDNRKEPKLVDWEQDYLLIASDINRIAGRDIRADSFCHWWTFISYFMGIGEGQLSLVVSIREKLRKGKKLEKWEREYYQKNRAKVDLKRRYTPDEEEFIRRVTGR